MTTTNRSKKTNKREKISYWIISHQGTIISHQGTIIRHRMISHQRITQLTIKTLETAIQTSTEISKYCSQLRRGKLGNSRLKISWISMRRNLGDSKVCWIRFQMILIRFSRLWRKGITRIRSAEGTIVTFSMPGISFFERIYRPSVKF